MCGVQIHKETREDNGKGATDTDPAPDGPERGWSSKTIGGMRKEGVNEGGWDQDLGE